MENQELRGFDESRGLTGARSILLFTFFAD